MWWLPSSASGERGPTKLIPIWCHGDFTGIGCSSGVPVVILRFICWQTSHPEIYGCTIRHCSMHMYIHHRWDYTLRALWMHHQTLLTVHHMRLYKYTTYCKSSFTSFTIPCRINLSLILKIVCDLCPAVALTWQAWRIFLCSSLFWTKRSITYA